MAVREPASSKAIELKMQGFGVAAAKDEAASRGRSTFYILRRPCCNRSHFATPPRCLSSFLGLRRRHCLQKGFTAARFHHRHGPDLSPGLAALRNEFYRQYAAAGGDQQKTEARRKARDRE